MMPFEISSSLFSANFLGNPGETFSFLSVDHRGAGKKRRESKSLEERKKVTTARSLVFPVVPKFRDFGKVRLPAGKRPRPPFLTAGGRRRKRAGSPHQQYPSAPTTTLSVGGGPPLPPLPFLLFLPANARGSPFLGRRKRKRERGDREDGPSSRMGTPPKKKTG